MMNLIEHLCTTLDISRTELSNRSGIPYNTLSQLASGRVRKLSSALARRLSVIGELSEEALHTYYRQWYEERLTEFPGEKLPRMPQPDAEQERFERLQISLPDELNTLRELTISLPSWMIAFLQTLTDTPSQLVYRALFAALKPMIRRYISLPPQTSRIPRDDARAELVELMHKYHRRVNPLSRAKLVPIICEEVRRLGQSYATEGEAMQIAEQLLLEYDMTPVAERIGMTKEIQAEVKA
jgi:hypothetical protein